MNYTTLQFSEEAGIGTLTIQRPEALNALNVTVVNELGAFFKSIESSTTLRCLILNGSGEKAFVAGADIKEIDQLDTKTARAFAEHGQFTFARIENCHVPVIAAVQGFALGGGLELALACDFIVASEKAKFGLPECNLGIMPGFGGTVRLPRRVGVAKAREIAMTGNFYSAADGLAMGLVNHVVAPEALMETTRGLALAIAAKAPKAIAAIKRSIYEGESLSQSSALALEANLFGELFGSNDQKEGTKAFIEKRKPVFKGN
jgi:enoyl-CoA hydratase